MAIRSNYMHQSYSALDLCNYLLTQSVNIYNPNPSQPGTPASWNCLHSVPDIEKALYASCNPVAVLQYTSRLPTTGVSEEKEIHVES